MNVKGNDRMIENRQSKQWLLAVLMVCCLLLCACAKNPTQDQLYSKLLSRLTDAGYAPVLAPVPDGQPVGIADASHWQQLTMGNETVLVYFDESNRADYLKTFVDVEQFGLVTRFGQRFVLTYAGGDEALISLLQEMDQY